MSIDDDTMRRVVDFHGHLCPGLTIGAQAASVALRELGPHSSDEEAVAVVETDMCSVDAIQVMTGCTFGKGNLLHRDVGKNAYTFFRRSDGRAIRVVGRPDVFGRDPEHEALRTKVKAQQATQEEAARFREIQLDRARQLQEQDAEELFAVQEIYEPPPTVARIHATLLCERCGEGAMETRIRRIDGRQVCVPCFEAVLAGSTAAGGGRGAPLPLAGDRP